MGLVARCAFFPGVFWLNAVSTREGEASPFQRPAKARRKIQHLPMVRIPPVKESEEIKRIRKDRFHTFRLGAPEA